MLCDNCGKNNANVRYLRNINGIKKEMNLCEECSKKLGITEIGFDMPIDFSSFLGGFLEDFVESDFTNLLEDKNEIRCKGCNSTFEDIANNGKFGCPECYETFESEINSILNKIQGSNTHVGRLGKIERTQVEKISKNSKETAKEENKIDQLKKTLKELVKDEKYEEAAKIRDEIKKLEKNNNEQ